jgi:hypothetical protein
MVITRQIFGTEQGVFVGQEKSIFGLFKMIYGTRECVFLGQAKLIFES